MNQDIKSAVYDRLLPGWRSARSVSGNRRVRCPLHEDHHPSLDVHEKDLVWICRAGCGGGGAFALAERVLGPDEARTFVRELDTDWRVDARNVQRDIEVLCEPSQAQIDALVGERRLRSAETLTSVGAKAIRWNGEEWLGFPTLAGGWKLWALDRNGVFRHEDGRLVRRNMGAGSIMLAPSLRDDHDVERLWDVEGESDLLAAIEAGLGAIAGTSGAGSLKGHNAHGDVLRALAAHEVCIVRDRDPAGDQGAAACAAWWNAQGVPARIVPLPEELGEHGDLRDYLNGTNTAGPMGDATSLDALADRAHRLDAQVSAPITEPTPDEDDALQRELVLPTNVFRGSFAEYASYLEPVTGADPVHAFAAWWAVLASCIGARRWGTWSGRVCLITFPVLMGPTGDHKTTAIHHAVELIPDHVRLIAGMTSDAGLFDHLEEAEGRPTLLYYDELGFLLKMAAIQNSTLDAMIRKLYDAPRFLDRNLSKRSQHAGGARRIESPFACMVGGIHPETFWQTLGSDTLALGSGFVNRLALFVAEGGKSLPITREPEPGTQAHLREHLFSLTQLNPSAVVLSPAAENLFRDFSVDHDKRIRSLDHASAAATKRIRDHVARLALAYATDADRTTINEADLTAAIEVGAYLEAGARRLLLARVPERGPARSASIETTVASLLRKRPGTWHSARDLQRSWPGSPPSAFEIRRSADALDDVDVERSVGRKPRYRLPPTTRHPTPKSSNSKAFDVGCRVGASYAE